MAKISARGDKEKARWQNDQGVVYVLTKKGRILRKLLPGDSFHLMNTKEPMSEEALDIYLAPRGFRRIYKGN